MKNIFLAAVGRVTALDGDVAGSDCIVWYLAPPCPLPHEDHIVADFFPQQNNLFMHFIQ